MHVEPTDIVVALTLALASGRVAYSITTDTIFRPLREWIWLRSAPEDSAILHRTDSGDEQRPARLYHDYGREGMASIFDYDPTASPRRPGFFGQLVECPFCMSFWTSALACVAWLLLGNDVIYPALPLALWALANTYATRAL